MADVTIDRLDISIELDPEGADPYFSRLFERHIRRWWALERARLEDRRFAERERRLPGTPDDAGGAPPW
jgi:hypothetical protein